MKRRPAVFLLLLLVLCTLLSSCAAAGLQSPALFTELEKNANKTGQALRGLLQNHAVLCENGEARYTLVADETLGADVTAELNALCAAITEKTGVALPTAKTRPEGAKAVLAELVIAPTKVRAYELNDSLFRIFFEDGDLHIAATNKVMLAEGVRRFTADFVTGEDAVAGNGYLGIPSEINVFADGEAVFDAEGKSGYTILFPEDASERVKNAAVSLTAAIKERTGKNVRIKSDFSSDTGARHEIVVGKCNRPGVAQATDGLDRVTYRIEANGKDVFLLGGSDEMVEAAVNAFLATFVNSPFASPKNTFSLPLFFSLEYTSKTVTAAAGGKTDYVLVYPSGASEAVKDAAFLFAKAFYRFTGAKLPVFSDLELPFATEYEIRLGKTNRSAESEELGADEWSILTQETIRINGGSDQALVTALNHLTYTCAQLIYTQNEIEDFNFSPPYFLYFIYGTAYRSTAS